MRIDRTDDGILQNVSEVSKTEDGTIFYNMVNVLTID